MNGHPDRRGPTQYRRRAFAAHPCYFPFFCSDHVITSYSHATAFTLLPKSLKAPSRPAAPRGFSLMRGVGSNLSNMSEVVSLAPRTSFMSTNLFKSHQKRFLHKPKTNCASIRRTRSSSCLAINLNDRCLLRVIEPAINQVDLSPLTIIQRLSGE